MKFYIATARCDARVVIVLIRKRIIALAKYLNVNKFFNISI